MRSLLSLLLFFIVLSTKAQPVFSIVNEQGFNYDGVDSLQRKRAPCVYNFRKGIGCDDVTICLAADTTLISMSTDYRRKIIFINKGLYERSVKDLMDSVRMNFSIIKEISKVFLYHNFSGLSNGVQVNEYELEVRSDYLAWAYCLNLFLKNTGLSKQLVDYLTADLNIKNIGLSIAQQQRRYILSRVLANNGMFDLAAVRDSLNDFDRIIHPVTIDTSTLYVLNIGKKRYEVKNFDLIFVNDNGVYKRCGNLYSLNSDCWYYCFKISLVNEKGNRDDYYVDNKRRIYDSLSTLAGNFEMTINLPIWQPKQFKDYAK